MSNWGQVKREMDNIEEGHLTLDRQTTASEGVMPATADIAVSKVQKLEKHDTITELPDDIQVKNFLPDYHKPYPVSTRKEEVYIRTDRRQAYMFAESLKEDYPSNIEELGFEFEYGLPIDVTRAKAILFWMAAQKIEERYVHPSTDMATIEGHFRLVIQGGMSYATLYAILCRAAGIPCVIIEGYAKTAAYSVGEQNIEHLRNAWNAIYVANSWRLVFPLAALSKVVGKTTGEWVGIEKQGVGGRKVESARPGSVVATCDDYYYLTNPEDFIYVCFPDDSEWQLLRQPITKDRFISLPYCKEAFFKNNLEISSEMNCILKSVKGSTSVKFRPKKYASKVHMTYELFFNAQESQKEWPSHLHEDAYVAIMNNDKETYFELRLPVKGFYKLVITDHNDQWVALFKIICDVPKYKCKPFPINNDNGFGPCLKTEVSGLIPKSHMTPVIIMPQMKTIEIEFQLTKLLQVRVDLVSGTYQNEDLHKCVSHRIKDMELYVNVRAPDLHGEYALQINTRLKGSEQEFENVCNYLLTTEDPTKIRKKYETPTEKKIRLEVNNAISSNSEEEILRTLDIFNSMRLEDKGENGRAQKRLEFLRVMHGLNAAIDARNLEAITKAIEAASGMEKNTRIQQKITKAQELAHQLKSMKAFSHDILNLSQIAVSEIHRYKEPIPKEVFNVMRATYLLLGEREDYLEEWYQIVALMKRTGKKYLMHQVRTFDSRRLSPERVQEASEILQPLDKDEVATLSAAVGAFYLWVTNVIKSFHNL